MSSVNLPCVSVVIPAYRASAELWGCLTALRRQTLEDREVIVVDSSEHSESTRALEAAFPEVVFDYVGARLGPQAARTRGAQQARGRIIAFTDSDCRPRPDWLAQLTATRDPDEAWLIGGRIVPAEQGWLQRGMHVCKFPTSLGDRPRRPLRALPTANAAISRAAWTRVGPFRVSGWAGDTELVWRASATGVPLHFVPDAVVEHRQQTSFRGFLRERVERGRAFASMRSAAEEWSRARTLTWVVAMPLVPMLMSLRVVRHTARTGWLGEAVKTVPVHLAGFTAWTAGEASSHVKRLLSRRALRRGRTRR
jgi:GT2 family glycosyltransferase